MVAFADPHPDVPNHSARKGKHSEWAFHAVNRSMKRLHFRQCTTSLAAPGPWTVADTDRKHERLATISDAESLREMIRKTCVKDVAMPFQPVLHRRGRLRNLLFWLGDNTSLIREGHAFDQEGCS